jgi:thiol-disulfide isomerase/thioredoxin
MPKQTKQIAVEPSEVKPKLEDFITPDHPNFKIIHSINDLPVGENFYLGIFAPWCHYCQEEITEVLNQMCNERETRCFAMDASDETNAPFINQLQLEGFPGHVICKETGKNAEHPPQCMKVQGKLARKGMQVKTKKGGQFVPGIEDLLDNMGMP